MTIDIESYLHRLRERIRYYKSNISDADMEVAISNARHDMELTIRSLVDNAMEQGIEAGYAKKSVDFINELRPDYNAFELETESSNTDFSLPPMPNLQNLLKHAKVSKEGTLYKVIPMSSNKTRTISKNIYDTQKRQSVEQLEKRKDMFSNTKHPVKQFRTATSRQDSGTQWVLPAQEADFTQDLDRINQDIETQAEQAVNEIITKTLDDLGISRWGRY